MSTRKKKNNFVQRLLKPIWQSFDAVTKAVVNRLLRSLLVLKRQSSLSRAGFVLPTVIMVILVVTLLTTAIMIRSFDRSKNASNVRVDQAVLKAATPALDRARAKIDKLFSRDETELQGNTPPEANIALVLENQKYTLGDETQIQLTGDFGGATPAKTTATDNPKILKSAWKFPVDTDNNGKFDTFTLYGIYFRNPGTTGADQNRARGTTEARALPQDDGQGDKCTNGSAGGVEGWTLIGGQLKKAFFTYVANVPITDTAGLNTTEYEKYKGNKGFSALEMQLDQARVSLDNNAVWYEDDISINNIPSLKLNGRVHTNSNLLVGNLDANPITFLQVSSKESCFYNPANAKIVVGGNVAAGNLGLDESGIGSNAVTADLYQGKGNPTIQRTIDVNTKTTKDTPSLVAGNSDAFAQRLDVLVRGAINLLPLAAQTSPTDVSVSAMAGRYPQEVIDAFGKKYDSANPGGAINALTQTLKTYFASRIRRVSLAEVPVTDPPTPDVAITVNGAVLSPDNPAPTNTTFVFAGGGEIKPPPEWMDLANTKLNLNINRSTMQMSASAPGTGAASLTAPENELGDRIQVGNNLPNRWTKNASATPVVYEKTGEPQPIPNVNWDSGSGNRARNGVAEQLDDLGDTSRNGYWESAAANALPPKDAAADLAGGLRVVTGAGIYVDGFPVANGTGQRIVGANPTRNSRSFLPEPTLSSEVDPNTLPPLLPGRTKPLVVWPDSMPMYQWIDRGRPRNRKAFGTAGIPEQFKGDLQMRATVVYHYKTGDDPIACISSYYDPTDTLTAADGISDNGFSYTPPTAAQRAASPKLTRQSRMVFPDGRWANKPLYDALNNQRLGKTLSLADKGAMDAANCALSILDGSAARAGSPVPDLAIKEAAFLDSRQIKAVHKVATEFLDPNITSPQAILPDTLVTDLNNPDHLKMASREALVASTTTPDYNLPLEQRQPLEVRVTEIDLEKLKGGKAGGESLLPNSGIIYATRDDALPDLSASQSPKGSKKAEIRDKANKPSESAATDFKLDPTRRPNGIRLINGENLERSATYVAAEKGLILASDLPVYIKGDFNLHQASGGGATLEEFKEQLQNTAFYDRKTPELNFACRQGSPTNCGPTGDQWRAARILSDAVTLLSDNFRDGYRYEGDYDHRNNAGNSAVESYLDNGFWMNSFATTAKWYGTGASPLPEKGSSYVTNGVTPIQRRVNFPAYKMEICTKLPVSECGPQDWKGGSIPETGPRVAGTTAVTPPGATPAAQYASEHYPRRVAFARDASGQLILAPATPTIFHAQPLRPGATPTPISYRTGVIPLAPQDNALWFATTTNNSDPSAGLDYNKNNLLYYAPDELEVPTATQPYLHERQLLLPGTPAFPQELKAVGSDPAFTGLTNQTILNGQTAQDPSDYAICTGGAQSQALLTNGPTAIAAGACPALADSRKMLAALNNLPAASDPTKALYVEQVDPTVVTPMALPLNAGNKVNIFELSNLPPTGQIPSGTITLNANGQSDPIFIIRRPTGSGQSLRFTGVTLQLNGVDPNNIFWINPGSIRITSGTPVGSTPNVLAGNFMGSVQLVIDDATQIKGGRFLGFGVTNFNRTIGRGKRQIPALTGNLQALTTTAQPLVVPVVQLHSPTGTPGAGGQNNDPLTKNWLQTAKDTTFNAVFVMGDSPARPLPGVAANAAELNGGLANFPRFLEDWKQTTTAKISGGLIQFKRSAVATAPFEAVTNKNTDTALFFDTPQPAGLSTFGSTDYKYRGGSSDNKAPYYTPPDRQWGYDVGLLSQTPDLFSRRFVAPQPSTPNEFFREVSRDDKWVNTLLCGKLVDPITGAATLLTALPTAQRPASCPKFP